MAKKAKKSLKEAADKDPKKLAKIEDEGEDKLHTPMEDEAEDEGADDKHADGDGDHADADQDIKLIKKMIGEYIDGDAQKEMSQQEMEALHELAHEAYMAHKEMGHKEEEAYMKAGDALKLAHHMSKKQKKVHEDEGEDMDGDISKKMPPGDDAKAKKVSKKVAVPSDDEEDEAEAEDEGKMESSRVKVLKNKLIEAEGRIAALEAKHKEAEVLGYMDKKLKESGLPVSITKRFRDVAGTVKSKSDFDSKWKVFTEGLNNNRRTLDWSALSEKATAKDDTDKKHSMDLDFSQSAAE